MNNTPLKILLVDDDEIDRLAVRRVLKKTDLLVTITEAESGEAAIATLQRQKFDIILLDYHLPDSNGKELINQIKKILYIDSPLIVFTGQGDEFIAVEMMKAGASDYLKKNQIYPDNLVKAIKNAIRIYQAEKAVALANQRLKATNELLLLKNQELETQKRQIKLQNIKLQEAYNLKSQFLATMSHELRTPMNAILGFSQLLLRQYPDTLTKTQQNLVQRIFNNGQNLLNMINEMLDFSIVESGKLELNIKEFNLANVVQLTLEELRSLAIEKNLKLETKINLQNSQVWQDSQFLKRILVNLLSNAIKFTEQGAIQVEVWETNPAKIAIAVTDTGIGIAPENIDIIFQAFRQLDQSFTRKYSGTGLGLAISESLVKTMGGTITVESQLGEGSTFCLKIPRKAHVSK
ncbi:MAG: ATP-binding protein [Xenococcaceae cyanobacterium MO_167.B27]|nr:ATP-binding protein [Xenococcaceae cyanobacterium MO_167.B27]